MKRSPHSLARTVVAATIVFIACLARARSASAAPCTIDMSFVRAIPDTHEYAIEFGSTVDGVADLRWTMYAGDRVYAVRFATTAFTIALRPSPKSIRRWRSEPVYVRLPDDAPYPSAAAVALVDPASHEAIPCSGGRLRLKAAGDDRSYDERTRFSPEAAVRAESEETRRALAGAAAATPVVPAATTVPARACDEPFRDASIAKIVEAEYPQSAAVRGEAGEVDVLVELDAAGGVLGTTVIGHGGSRALDEAAVSAAAKSTYRPERFRCENVSDSYLFQVDFTGR